MSQLTPKESDYYAYLMSSEDAPNGAKPKQVEFAVNGCSINTFIRIAKIFEEPTRGVHEVWCEKFPGKARRLNQLYHRIWGSDDPDESLEQSTVFSGVTAGLLRVECEQVRRRKSDMSLLDRRFALEQLAMLSEMEKDWATAHELLKEMLRLQKKLEDPIYLARAHVKKAYITYKLARTSGNLATLDEATADLDQAATVWTELRGTDWEENHPDVKALLKWFEIRALIFCRKGQIDRAVEAIRNARKLRDEFSGLAGKASGAYREGVVYSQAVELDPKNAELARRAFQRSIDLREKLNLPGDAGIAAWRWAEFERAEVEASRTNKDRWFEALEKAFWCFGASNDAVRQLDVALAILEHNDEAFGRKGAELMMGAVPRAFEAAFRGGWDAFRAHLDRPGWKTWASRDSRARALLHSLLVAFASESEKRAPRNILKERSDELRNAFTWLSGS